MRDARHTLFELVRHIAKVHPELQPNLERCVLDNSKLSYEQLNFIRLVGESIFKRSRSQLRQDLFVLFSLNFKTNGFFVEFGATNGIELSNTFLLEKEFGWTGILAEPAACWHSELRRNRNCRIETSCVWHSSGLTIPFNEVEVPELSTIQDFGNDDKHKDARKYGKVYDVNSISLNDLLRLNNAPKNIDYLSIDTEGSEYEILRAFDFSRYRISIITCEHNFTESREKIHELLTGHGYKRVFSELSDFDDWYTLEPN